MAEPLHSAGERFTREQVRRILGMSKRQLTAWERQGLVQPARPSAMEEGTGNREQGTGTCLDPALRNEANKEPGRSRNASQAPSRQPAANRASQPDTAGTGQAGSRDCYYTFSDIITLKTLLRLRRNGVPPARLRLAHAALKRKLAEVEKPWSELQIKGAGKNLTVQFKGVIMEPLTGQLFLDYAHQDKQDDKQDPKQRVRPFQRAGHPSKRSQADKKAIAERFFMAGLRYEERGGIPQKAIQAYQKAIEMNPEAVGAFINLGTIYYNLGQLEAAESCYRAALSIDPGYALVHFNLGNVFDERDELEKARLHYEEAVHRDPTYPDPHYNLALVYEKLGLHGKARQQWVWYLKLDRDSKWASYARQQLQKTPLRIIQTERPLLGDLSATEKRRRRED